MESTVNQLWKIATLDEATFREFLASENVMKRGFLIMLACLFIATIPVFGTSLINNIRGFTPEAAADLRDQFSANFQMFQPPGMEGVAEMEDFMSDFLQGVNIGVDIDALPTPLPRPIASFLKALGSWVTSALSSIGPWLGYGAIVVLFAKLAGGRGVLNHFFGLTALYAVPGLLRIFSFIPFLGPVVVAAALIWGAVVYVRGVQISQEFSAGKALLITLLPVLIVLALGICLGSVGLASLFNLISSSQ